MVQTDFLYLLLYFFSAIIITLLTSMLYIDRKIAAYEIHLHYIKKTVEEIKQKLKELNGSLKR